MAKRKPDTLGCVNEGSTATYRARLTTPSGTAITAGMLQSLTLTVYNKSTGDIIRDVQDVRGNGSGQHNVTISDDGEIAWTMQATDTVILNRANRSEMRIALWELVASGPDGPVPHRWEIQFQVVRLGPAS